MAVSRSLVGRLPRLIWSALSALVLLVSLGFLVVEPTNRVDAQAGGTVNAANFSSIQAAIDSVKTSGGAVYIPAGTHQVTAKVRVYSNVTVFGAGMDQTIIRFAPGVQVDHLMSNSSLPGGNANLVIRDLTLAGNNEARGADCCFGLRLVNVQSSFVINVAADNHSLDGIYLGYNTTNGAVNNRISGCRVRGNGRNGIAITHGRDNVIDNCRVENNNTREAVAGIDLEPDDGLSVTGSKLVSNQASGQNVGIQLYSFDRSRAPVSNNAVCTNTTTSNVNAGIYDFNGSSNIYVNNTTSGNNHFFVDGSALIGPQYAGSCALGSLPNRPPLPPGPPTRTPTPTLTPTPTPVPTSCNPRPRIQVNSQPSGAGRLSVTVTVDRPASGPNNTLRSIRFGTATNGLIDIGSTSGSPGGINVPFPSGSAQATFFVRRVTAGAAVTVPFAVVDDCGDWPTFVGGGPAAF